MITPLLQSALEPIVGRHRLLHQLFWCVVLLFLAVVALLAARLFFGWQMPGLLVVFLGLVAVRLGLWFGNRWQPDYTAIARRIESKHPDLHSVLLTAVEQRPDPATGALNFLQLRVLAEAAGLAQKEQWIDAVPRGKLAAHWALLAVMIACLLTAGFGFRRPVQHSAGFVPAIVDGVEITPGDVSLERGHGLVILAKFNPTILPSEAALVIEAPNQPVQRIGLVKNFEDPVFSGGLPEVNADMAYRIEYAGKATRDFKVNVFEYPRLDRADATLHFPEYTKLPEKTLKDTHRASAVEGSQLDVAFQLNKPVKSAMLVAKDGTSIPLKMEAGAASAVLQKFAVRTSQTYELKLVDAEGRSNKVPEQFRIEALANRRPELKFIAPKGDKRVSPLEEVDFKAEAWDDFGISRYGIAFNVAGRGENEIELGTNTLPDERRALSHLLKLEELGTQPDELISWFIWAEDIGPDGKARRTATDLFFGEVRPFEEIFRAGDGSEEAKEDQEKDSNGGGKQEQATKLAELQKQIIQATWNLKRSEEGITAAPEKPSDKYRKDEPVVRDSQGEALAKAKALSKEGEDPKAEALVANVVKEMQSAFEHLTKAEQTSAILPDALGSEQSAYNALLKLAAHEFNVVRNKKSQSRGSQASQKNQQQQLDELEIKEEKQRYETKRDAEPQKNEEQRSELAILNRLKELAQRQQDINEKLKEFQNALEAAKTEPEKEEIKRQLKRLREEEQQMIADLDEARQKMEQSPQQAQLAEERKQIDQTRSEAQQAAESMQKNAASQALASGTRAAQDLQKMREDFRKKTSGQFTDEMREMRTEARELASNQEQIAEKLKPEPGKAERRTLGGDSEREKLAQQFEKQQSDLAGITEKMKTISEQAEAAEPLLAKELYDTLRKTAQSGTGDTLQIAQRLAQRGSASQAQQFEQKARQEIEELKSGVERAAESVLGDEAEALRQARAELDTLSDQLNRELAMGRGPGDQQPGGQQPGGQQPGGQQAGGQQPGGQQPGGQQPGGQQPGGQQPGGQQPGGQQPGGQQPGGQQPGGQQPGGQQPGGQQPGGQQPGGQQPGGQQPGGQQPGGQQPGGQQPGGQQPGGQQPGGQQPGGQQPGGQQAGGQQPGGQQPGGQQPGGQQPGGQQPGGQQPGGQQPGGQQPGGQQPGGQQPGGQQPGGQQPGGQQPGGQQPGGQQPGGQQPGGQQTGGQQTGGQQPGGQQTGGQQTGGQQPGGQQPGGQQTGGQQPGGQQPGGQQPGSKQPGGQLTAGPRRSGQEGGGFRGGAIDGEQAGPLTGDNFAEWSDRLRNVEEMIDDPKLRTEAARIREAAKGVRVEVKRHSVAPNWDIVQSKISTPLAELRNRLTEELARRESRENLVPIDRDPVPGKYAERVRLYYEELGRSR